MAGIKDRLIQFILRGKDELSPEAKKSAAAMEGLRVQAEELGQALDNAKATRGMVTGLEATRRAVEQSASALEQGEQNIEGLRRALDANPESAGLQASLVEAERQATRMRQSLTKLRRSLADQEQAAQAAGIDTNNLADEQQRLAAEVERASTAVKQSGEAIRELERSQAAASRSTAENASRIQAVREGMSGGAKQALAFAAAFVSLNAVFGLVQAGLNKLRGGIYAMLATGDQYELLGKRMASLMGGVAQGEQATAWIKDFAKSTPLEVKDVTDAFALLKSYGLDPMDGSLQAIVDKNEQLGGGMERLQGISSALGQAYAKQKLQTEEILQLVERGVPAWTMLEKVTGKNAAQLADLASKGRLGRDVIAGLIDEMGRSAEGAAADNMSTLTGLVSNLSDVWSDFLNRIAKSGALDYAKEQLKGVADYIDRMDKDGRLDKLATSLSKAFEQGGEKLKEFADRLVDTDFDKLLNDSSNWLDNFGNRMDAAAQRVQLFIAPFRTLVNGLTTGLSLAGTGLAQFVDFALARLEVLAKAVPASIGGDELRRSIAEARGLMAGLTDGFLEQIEQDSKDIADAWDTTSKSAAASVKEQTEAVRRESSEQMMLAQAAADHFVANQQRSKDAAIDAAASGQQAVEGMAQALQLLDGASTVQQLESLRGALLAAYKSGALSQQEYAQATTLLNGRIKELQGAAAGAAEGVSDLDEALGDLQSVQAAISNAKTDVEINNIRAALRKLFESGKITAEQYNAELEKTAARQRELKGAVSDGAKEQDKQNQAMEEAIETQEDLRRASGKRMEEERRAGGEAMERRRKEGDDAKKDMAGVASYFDAVLSRAREPLAQLSAASLEAFDRIRGLGTAKVDIDTSSLEATAASLKRVNDQLASVRLAEVTPGMSNFGRWQLDTQRQSLALQEAALGQKLQLQQLMDRYDKGGITLGQFVQSAKSAKNSMKLLDAADLSALESAIQSAQEQMKQLGESTRSTLEGLQDELDGLEGREAEAERRRFAARQRELQAQLAEAQASGDSTAVSNAQRAMGVLRQIESATALKRQQDEQKQRMAAAAPAQAAQPAAPTKVIRLETARGKAVDVAVNSADDETKLLGILEDAGLRSL